MRKLIFIIGLLFGCNAEAANIEATVNKNIVPQGEVFVLTLTADESLNERPDFSVLNSDYNVYSTSVSHSSYVVNSKTSSTTKWQTIMSAKKEGKQKIPAIKVGKYYSNEVDIEILPQGAKHDDVSDNNPTYAMRTEIKGTKTPYVQEMITYDVIITDIGGLQGSEPIFDNSDEWIIKKIGQPDVISKYINGKNVREIVFHYALFAQKSGKVSIPAVRFNGYTISDSGGGIFSDHSMFSLNIGFPSKFGFEVPVNLFAPAKQIEILPVPTGYQGKWWLPAKNVEIKAKFSNDAEFVEGEAFSREVELTVVGVVDSQLPDINFENSPDVKQYPQKSMAVGELINGEPVAVKKVTNVYIPQKSGEIILPAIKVEWFNVDKQKIEVSEVKSEKIMVKPNAYLKKVSAENENKEQQTASEQIHVGASNTLSLAQIVSLMIGVFAFGMLLGYHIFRCRMNKNAKPQCEQRKYPDFIIKKAYEDDFRALRDALISWAIGFYPNQNITTLKDVAAASGDDIFSEQIDLLIAKLYDPNNTQVWNAKTFVENYKKICKNNKKKNKNDSPLPKLYE